MIGIIGKKLGMTQIFDEQGQQIPCTVVEATPNPVTKVVTTEQAGYAAVELGFGSQRVARESKAVSLFWADQMWQDDGWMDRALERLGPRVYLTFDVVELAPTPGLPAPDFLVAKLVYKLIGYRFP